MAAQDADRALVARLQRGDEAAFREVVARYHMALLRMARMYVATQQAAEDVVGETWLGVVQGIERFEGRSSLKTWLFRILMNRARTRAVREGRNIPFSALASNDDDDEPSVAAERFIASGPDAGHWSSLPRAWDDIPEERLLALETRARIQEALDALPVNQRSVLTLRDIEGFSSAEVCNMLDISETNQRVLLHRARARVRQALEAWLNEREDA
ncbi:MAG: RNA polymerase subunit sigma-24 [Chloroflexi bacterium]|nr:MAG: RNA polymerase subunit sigma-24 [Chloroflexota bacterium]